MTAPLFQGGALRAQVEDAKLTSANAWWQYRETLLTAVQETQNALDSETALSARISHTNVALANAERSVSTIEGQYRQGLADILDLLSVYDTRFNLQAQAVELHAQKLQNRIDLGLALGLECHNEKQTNYCNLTRRCKYCASGYVYHDEYGRPTSRRKPQDRIKANVSAISANAEQPQNAAQAKTTRVVKGQQHYLLPIAV